MQFCHHLGLRKHPFLLALRSWGRFARRNERWRLSARQKFHTNDVKSVRTEALIGRRSSYIALAILHANDRQEEKGLSGQM